ncbi:MAG: response regulator [Flavisolibacter sp.]
MESRNSKPIILYAEDDFDDFESVREALEQLSSHYTLIHAKDGTAVLSYLEKNVDKLPCLIVLDLNMPIMDGKEVLVWLKDNQPFSHIPTMIFTTSSREEDVKLCQKHDCTFFRKPTLYRDLLHIVQVMIQMCDRAPK